MEVTLLLTGFEPFGRWEINPSSDIARSLDGETVGRLRVTSRQLPVNWEETWPALRRAIDETQPSYILLLGLAGRRPDFSVESRACNSCGDTGDNAGRKAASSTIQEGGPQYLHSTLPVGAIAEAIRAAGYPAQISEDAGLYLCNNSLYNALAWAATRPNPPAVGFLHVPNTPGANPEIEGVPLDDMVKAVRAAIEAISRAG